jgi:hypothetical protein
VRLAVLVLALLVGASVAAQENPVKKKKAPAKKAQAAHKKPTAEQIRKFNELQKKQ